jgi:hypothetical protein
MHDDAIREHGMPLTAPGPARWFTAFRIPLVLPEGDPTMASRAITFPSPAATTTAQAPEAVPVPFTTDQAGVVAGRLVRLMVVAALTAVALPASADWFPGEPHKMHFPQMPNPNGWDINITGTNHEVADDWKCSETGAVSDLHFWYSVQGDDPGTSITSVTTSIYSDLPGLPFSRPDQLLWTRTFSGSNAFSVIPYGSGTQGFANPQSGTAGWIPDDHSNYWQLNLKNIPDPFTQTLNTTYWLGLSVQISGTSLVGWKTSLDAFQDDSTFRGVSGSWNELIDPFTLTSLHQAFVVTPEPSTLAILSTGCLVAAGLAAARRQRSVSRGPARCETARDPRDRDPR